MSDALTEIDKAAKNVVTFMSRSSNYRLVRRPRQVTYNEVGQTLREQTPLRYEFRNHVLNLRPGRNVMVECQPNWLKDGEDVDAERDEVEALKAHRDFNTEFWIEGEEPGKPKPYVEQVIKEMSDAVARVDVDRLQALLDAERSTHNRPLLTTSLTSALESVSAVAAEYAAQEEVPVHGDGENDLEWSEGYPKDQLQAVADRAGIEVKGTGTDGAVLKDDLVKALRKATPKSERKA